MANDSGQPVLEKQSSSPSASSSNGPLPSGAFLVSPETKDFLERAGDGTLGTAVVSNLTDKSLLPPGNSHRSDQVDNGLGNQEPSKSLVAPNSEADSIRGVSNSALMESVGQTTDVCCNREDEEGLRERSDKAKEELHAEVDGTASVVVESGHDLMVEHSSLLQSEGHLEKEKQKRENDDVTEKKSSNSVSSSSCLLSLQIEGSQVNENESDEADEFFDSVTSPTSDNSSIILNSDMVQRTDGQAADNTMSPSLSVPLVDSSGFQFKIKNVTMTETSTDDNDRIEVDAPSQANERNKGDSKEQKVLERQVEDSDCTVADASQDADLEEGLLATKREGMPMVRQDAFAEDYTTGSLAVEVVAEHVVYESADTKMNDSNEDTNAKVDGTNSRSDKVPVAESIAEGKQTIEMKVVVEGETSEISQDICDKSADTQHEPGKEIFDKSADKQHEPNEEISDKSTGKQHEPGKEISDKSADKQHEPGKEISDKSADKQHEADKEISDKSADKQHERDKEISDKSADKQHEPGKEISDKSADKQHESGKEISDKSADKQHEPGKEISDKSADKQHEPGKEISDKSVDKQHEPGKEISDKSADKQHEPGKEISDKSADKQHEPNEEVSDKSADKQHEPGKEISDKSADKQHEPNEEVSDKTADKQHEPGKEISDKSADKQHEPGKEISDKSADKQHEPGKEISDKSADKQHEPGREISDKSADKQQELDNNKEMLTEDENSTVKKDTVDGLEEKICEGEKMKVLHSVEQGNVEEDDGNKGSAIYEDKDITKLEKAGESNMIKQYSLLSEDSGHEDFRRPSNFMDRAVSIGGESQCSEGALMNNYDLDDISEILNPEPNQALNETHSESATEDGEKYEGSREGDDICEQTGTVSSVEEGKVEGTELKLPASIGVEELTPTEAQQPLEPEDLEQALDMKVKEKSKKKSMRFKLFKKVFK